MNNFPVGSYLVMKSTSKFPGERPLLANGYKYNYRKVLGSISAEGDGSTEPGNPYLSCLPDIYSNFYVCPVVRPHLLVSYFNACNSIYNHNSMCHSDLAIDKYWVT